ncbi:MAG: WhiB family transcriptional regulator [Actinobacteria bacterium]|nr:MAG: WhiB family transcriptional regulator [Actinomycetota bacterium]
MRFPCRTFHAGDVCGDAPTNEEFPLVKEGRNPSESQACDLRGERAVHHYIPWQERARCREHDPEIFFPEKGGSSREAKRICADCPVRIECLNYALRRDERYGVWGGMSERERRRLKRMAS